MRELNLRYNSTLTDLSHEKKQNQRYQENVEQLVEENKKLQQYRIKYETSEDQVRELKALIASYQAAMEENNTLFGGGSSASRAEPRQPRNGRAEPEAEQPAAETDPSVVVKLRD